MFSGQDRTAVFHFCESMWHNSHIATIKLSSNTFQKPLLTLYVHIGRKHTTWGLVLNMSRI
jgi:hypothetical protein